MPINVTRQMVLESVQRLARQLEHDGGQCTPFTAAKHLRRLAEVCEGIDRWPGDWPNPAANQSSPPKGTA